MRQRLLGLSNDLRVTGAQGRPQSICIGKPVKALIGWPKFAFDLKV